MEVILNIKEWLVTAQNNLKWADRYDLTNSGYIITAFVSFIFLLAGYHHKFWEDVLGYSFAILLCNVFVYVIFSMLIGRENNDEKFSKEIAKRLVFKYSLWDKTVFIKELQDKINEETENSKKEDERIAKIIEKISKNSAEH